MGDPWWQLASHLGPQLREKPAPVPQTTTNQLVRHSYAYMYNLLVLIHLHLHALEVPNCSCSKWVGVWMYLGHGPGHGALLSVVIYFCNGKHPFVFINSENQKRVAESSQDSSIYCGNRYLRLGSTVLRWVPGPGKFWHQGPNKFSTLYCQKINHPMKSIY